MSEQRNYGRYAAKMRKHVESGTDLEVDVRFIDMLSARGARILDIGCGIGATVRGLRKRGHDAYGIDPTETVLRVARELHDPEWFRPLSATQATPEQLAGSGLPPSYDVVLLSGNVPSFVPADELPAVFACIEGILVPGGLLVTGTTTGIPGGPADQDAAAEMTGLTLEHRYADWHLGAYASDSPWSVSVFAAAGTPEPINAPDGIFVLSR
ncbi:class I SAM-dependent methyltransferase [Arthrobacter sp. JSM 101049]|uniref:class I SAM-dependent methyltransferase n=1 Tax=Arthrobacter sp. JSM 101049 TaxID=929097 RepID=UPI0035654592